MLIALVLAGCNSEQPEALSFMEKRELINQINSNGEMTDEQAESLSGVDYLNLQGLTSITDVQAESLSGVSDLDLLGLTSITDAQAESLSKVEDLTISEALQPLIDKSKKP